MAIPQWFSIVRNDDDTYSLTVSADVTITGSLNSSRSTDDGSLIKIDGEGGIIQLQVSFLDGEIRLGDYDGGVYYQTINDEGFYLQTVKTVDIGDPDVSGNGTSFQIDDPNQTITLKKQVIMPDLPIEDPLVVGALWNSDGTLMISAGVV